MLPATKKELSAITTTALKLDLNKYILALEYALIDEKTGTATMTNLDERVEVKFTEPGMAAEDTQYLVNTTELRKALKSYKSAALLVLRAESDSVQLLDAETGMCILSQDILDLDEFPNSEEEYGKEHAIPAEALPALASLAPFCATDANDRRRLHTIYLNPEKGEAVALDGRALMRYCNPEAAPVEVKIKPTKYVLGRLLKQKTDLQISISDNRVRLRTCKITYSQYPKGGKYPRYEQVIPSLDKTDTALLRLHADMLCYCETVADTSKIEAPITLYWDNKRVFILDASEKEITLPRCTILRNNSAIQHINLNFNILTNVLKAGATDIQILDEYTPIVPSSPRGELNGAWMSLRE